MIHLTECDSDVVDVPNDMSEEEIQRLERTIAHIQLWSQRLIEEAEEVDDENICTICYAYQKNTTFKPCNHRSCKYVPFWGIFPKLCTI